MGVVGRCEQVRVQCSVSLWSREGVVIRRVEPLAGVQFECLYLQSLLSQPLLQCLFVNVSRTGEKVKLRDGQEEVFRWRAQIPRSLCVLLTEAEVQAGALCDWGGGASTGHRTGGDTAIFKTQESQSIIFVTHVRTNSSDLNVNLKTDKLSGTNPTF